MVFKFAKPFFRVYSLFLAFIRLVTLLANVFISTLYHIKFRKVYCDAIYNMCEQNQSVSDFKFVQMKNFRLFYTTKNLTEVAAVVTALPKSSSSLENTAQSSGSNRKILMYAGIKNMQSHYEHMHFLRYYAKVIFVYSLLIAPSVFKDSLLRSQEHFSSSGIRNNTVKFNDDIESTRQDFNLPDINLNDSLSATLELIESLNFLSVPIPSSNMNMKKEKRLESTPNTFIELINGINDDQTNEDTYVKVLVHFSQLLAHSTKFLFYLMFSFHVKLLLKYNKPAEISL